MKEYDSKKAKELKRIVDLLIEKIGNEPVKIATDVLLIIALVSAQASIKIQKILKKEDLK